MDQIEKIRDERVRSYLPVRRVLASRNCQHAEQLVGNTVIQCFSGGLFCNIELGADGFVLLDFGRELAGGIRLVTARECPSARVRIRFGESVSEAMNQPNMDHAIHDVTLPVGMLSVTEFGGTGFRFVRLDAADTPVVLLNVVAVALELEPEQPGVFRSSDPRVNRIFDTAVETVRLNMQDYIYDGIKRDRLIWIGDLHPELSVILRTFGDLPVVARTLAYADRHTPGEACFNHISSYSLWFVLCIYDWYLHTGRTEVIAEHRERLREIVDMFSTCVGADGAEKLPGARFLDWPSQGDEPSKHAGLQALFVQAMRRAAALLEAVGEDGAPARNTASAAARHVPDPGRNKAAAALLTLAGLADRRDVLEDSAFCGVSTFYGYYMLLAKRNRPALELIRRYWGGMLDLGATAFWEDFDLDWVPGSCGIDEIPVPGRRDIHADFGNYCYRGLRHSLCHGWAAGPAAWLSRRVLGASVLAPGCRRIEIAPDLCGLEWIEGSLPTPFGKVSIRCDRSGRCEIAAPAEVEVVEKKPVL